MLKEGFEPIPGYRLQSFLGRGQFGEVWRSTSPGGTQVALKFLNVRERQGRKEFRAIQKVKGIRHPHLVLTYALWLLDEDMQVIDDAAFDENQPLLNDTFGATLLRQPVQEAESVKPFMLVIATVLCEKNLMERLREYQQKGERGFPLRELIEYIEDAAKAIDYLNSPRHELGDGPVAIHHCDIKPENIMVLGDLAIVGDFGVARILRSGADSRSKSMGGSVAYAAPETFDNRTEATSDQYSLAVTYYELRTGKLPFPEESQAQVIRDKLAGKLDFSDVPSGEAKVLQRAMSVLPGNRYPSARAFVDALRIVGGAAEPKSKWRRTFATLAITGVIAFGMVSTALLYNKNRSIADSKPDTPPGDKEKEVEIPQKETQNKSKSDEAVQPIPNIKPEPQFPPKSVKPFVVSWAGQGTHITINSAIADSAPGDTIRIEKGTYRESVVIPFSMTLIGEGLVTIAASDDACIQLQNAGKVQIENVTFDSNVPDASAINVDNGSLELSGCELLLSGTKTLHCVTVSENASLIAEKCKFQSVASQAVVAKKGASLTLRDSRFSFKGNSTPNAKRIGVQGTGASGLIQDCRFVGACNVGIDWIDSPNHGLKIEGCRFEKCDIGIQTKSCNNVVIKGVRDRPCVISNAVWGLNLLQSQVDISTIKVEGLEERNKIAFRIMERSTVNCIDCGFDGHSCGIFVEKSSLIVDGVTISRPRCVGMVVDGASVNGDSLLLSNIPKYGLMTLGKDASVTLNSFEVQAAPNLELNFPVYATSGRIEFKKGVMADCACGIFVDPRREFMDEAELSERLGLKERIGIAVKSEGSPKPVEIVSHQLTLKNCKRVWVFNGAGSSQIKQLKSDLTGDQLTPKLLNTPKNEHVLTQQGTDLTNFEVTEAKKKE